MLGPTWSVKRTGAVVVATRLSPQPIAGPETPLSPIHPSPAGPPGRTTAGQQLWKLAPATGWRSRSDSPSSLVRCWGALLRSGLRRYSPGPGQAGRNSP